MRSRQDHRQPDAGADLGAETAEDQRLRLVVGTDHFDTDPASARVVQFGEARRRRLENAGRHGSGRRQDIVALAERLGPRQPVRFLDADAEFEPDYPDGA